MSCPFHTPESGYPSTTPVSFARYPDESWLFGGASAVARNALKFFERCEQTAGIVRTRFLVKRVYVVTDPTAIADVLVNHPKSFVKPYVLRRMKVLFGNGLLTSSGEQWANHRHLVQPAFGAECMTGFLRLVNENTEKMFSSWRDGDVRDVYPEIVDLCMKNVAQTLFGVYDEEMGSIVRALAATCHDLTHAVLNVGQLLPFHLPGTLKRRLERELGALNNYLGHLIDQRRNEPPRRDFLGLLLSGGEHHAPLSRQDVLDESVTMLLAGHETTASALAWSLYLLARHPKHADALAADLESHLEGEAPSMSDLEDLTSLRATLDETMRLYPPTHRIGRTVVSPVVIGGHEIPVGADVLVPQWAVHRSARWYDRPLDFLPERWTPAFRRSLPKFAYFPFSGGPRICVGTQLAYSEVEAILGLLAQRFRYSMCDDSPLLPYEGLTLLPAGGHLRLKLKRRSMPSEVPNEVPNKVRNKVPNNAERMVYA
ncbi:MAG TPA: cytochrome P450 [Candidatus Sulfotelmatobacter sp.]